MLQYDAKTFFPLMTLWFLMLSTVLPFYAQAKLNVKLPEHYLPVGGCALLCAAQLYLYITEYIKPKFDAATVIKASAAFLGVFSLQFVFCPQFLYDTNFSDGKTLDEIHIFICRGFGIAGLYFCAVVVQLDAVAYLKYLTIFNTVFSCVMPFYAQAFLPVRLPDHYVPVGGMVVLIAAHVYLYLKAK
jgi:CDP-diglyceride synthetase